MEHPTLSQGNLVADEVNDDLDVLRATMVDRISGHIGGTNIVTRHNNCSIEFDALGLAVKDISTQRCVTVTSKGCVMVISKGCVMVTFAGRVPVTSAGQVTVTLAAQPMETLLVSSLGTSSPQES
jgi:hypothetical protein